MYVRMNMEIVYCKLSCSLKIKLYFKNITLVYFSCWLSVYESVVWWLVGPIAGMSLLNLLILFVSLKAAFTLKDHVLGFGNLR